MVGLLKRDRSILILVDFQQRLAPAMQHTALTEEHILRMLTIAHTLGVPLLITEQYPRGLGVTTDMLRDWLIGKGLYQPIEKQNFSCLKEEEFINGLNALGGKNQLLFMGIEAHVCVLQSALHAREKGYETFVISSCISSRKEEDFDCAIHRMRAAGVTVLTHEMCAFEWLERAGTAEFKTVQKLILH